MFRSALIGLLTLATLLALTVTGLAPPAPRASGDGFQAVRAHEHVKAIARAPHPTGSAEHTRVREHLVAELRALGLEVRVQEGVGVLPLDIDGVTPMGTMRNIVAVRPGTDPTGRVVLAAHYDSVPAAPGAADDGAGVATVLEVVRSLPPSPRNDLVVLLTDGEEQGLLGAEAFARDDPMAKGTVVVVNNEARGVRGAVQMFRASPGSAPLVDLYGTAAPHPSADSAFAALLSILPNNTDFHVFDEAGWLGLDSAFVGGGAYYHSPLDDPAHLSLSSLQQMGDNTLGVARALSVADLTKLRTGEESVYFTVPGTLIRYPLWLELPIALAVLALAAALAWTLRRPALGREDTASLPRTLAASLLALVPVLLSAAAGYGLMPLLALIRPAYADMFTGDPYRPWLYQAALLTFTAAVVLVWRGALRRLGTTALAAGSLLLVAVLGVVSAALLPGGAHTPAWPALFAAAGWLVSRRLPGTALPAVALTVGLAPAVLLLGAAALTSLDVGLGIGGMIAAPHFALFTLLLLPLVDHLLPAGGPRERRGFLPPLTVAAAAVVLLAAGLVVDRFDAAHPRQVRLAYAMDAGAGRAVWGTRSATATPGSEHFFTSGTWTATPAGPASLRAPELAVLKDETTATQRTLTLRLKPTGGAPVTGLSLAPGAAPARITVNGRSLTSTGFAYHAPPEDLRVTLTLPPGPAQVRVFEQSHDLPSLPGYQAVPDSILMNPLATIFRVHPL
ncbi:M28 family peptidase [Nonomuraea sp. SBT364]|uniref:M28 family peptidase n=1 Tax=Nonomuraea sp. SBT364 TaxID=1580530 RepID=UPI00066B4404|nr:M28 family peptidase [Nonomuraea sp. SBT364]